MPNNNEEAHQEVIPGQAQLDSSITQKINYLQTLQAALEDHDDRQIYELIDKPRYDREVKKSRSTTKSQNLADLIADDHEQLSHYLSENLIDYLGQTYPFFYYDEVKNGEFDIYFGNWWDRRKFGKLDVLNVAFEFDETEYNKLKRAFELDALNQRYNTENIAEISAGSAQLQKLIDGQDERDHQKETLRQQLKEVSQKSTLPWDSGKVKEERQGIVNQLSQLADEDEEAINANKKIKENDEKILSLSKEDTILTYEKQSIQQRFEDFSHFESHNQSLYTDYLTNLIGKGQVKADD
ncbi:exonuclease SbcC [Lactobacillus sp. LC28-10]|uniref:Exonuclease SbcC n=1 Tax=Secundilactobacillus angelensis TaxID=2722706 RepID=A0ABX1L2S0_9LACO|nr:exonuclease SbcC [Secundilactobacillus angelensis]MCH5463387.1 exonuclease SbcC [Secundilactobacillus angelensis]NLR19488.1 exonuclease SbcC [Secundilactobacillus angelensis]